MKKLLSLLAVGAALAMLTGCGLNDPSSDPTVTVTIGAIGSAVVGSDVNVEITVESDSAISTVVPKVYQGTNDVTTKFTISGLNQADYQNKEKVTLNIKLKAVTAENGSYTLKVTATAKSLTDDDSRPFTVTGGSVGTPIKDTTVTIGSYDNATYGSSIDLDNAMVMKAAAAKASGSGVDVVFTYSDAGKFRVLNPVYASSTSGIVAFQNWTNPADTKFHKVSVTFASITTKEQIAPLYQEASGVTNSDAVIGDVFVVKTTAGYALIEIKSFESNVAGTASIKFGY